MSQKELKRKDVDVVTVISIYKYTHQKMPITNDTFTIYVGAGKGPDNHPRAKNQSGLDQVPRKPAFQV